MINLLYEKLKSVGKEFILINLFSKRILFICRKIWVCEIFLIKLYFKATNIPFHPSNSKRYLC